MKIKKLVQKIKNKFAHQIHDEFKDINLGMGSTYLEDIQRLNNKKIQENPNRYGEAISWHELVDNDFLTDYEQIQLRRHGEICDPTPCMFN